MHRLKNLKISLKVLLAPAAIMLALAGTAWVAFNGARTQELAMLRLQQEVELPMRQAIELRDAAAAFQSRSYALISSSANETDTGRLNAEATSLLQRLPELTAAAAAFQARLESLHEGQSNSAVVSALADYAAAAHDTVDMLRTMPAYSAIMMNDTERRFVVLREQIDALVNRMDAKRTEIASTFVESTAQARIALIATLVLSASLSAAAALAVGRMIARPIIRLTDVMRRLAGGDLAADVSGDTTREDEVGAMAAAVQVFKDNLIEAKRLHAEQENARARDIARLRKFVNSTFEGILIHRQGIVLDANAALCQLLGYSGPAALRSRHIGELVIPEAAELVEERLMGGSPGSEEVEALRADGSSVPVEVLARPMEYDGADAVIVAMRDLSERKEAEDRIRHLAYYDALTDLPNRSLFNDRLTQALASAARSDTRVAVLSLDLDRFKFANDFLGHKGGDKLLQQVAERLRANVRSVDTIARLGGDEFAAILPLENDSDVAGSIARRMLDAIAQPFDIDGQQVEIGCSVGVSIYPTDGQTGEILLKNSDLALYHTKNEGRGRCHFFESGMDLKIRMRRGLERDLRQAIHRGELTINYQPIYSCATGEVECLEALLRWNHSTRGMIPASDFIPVAEETGLIGAMGLWVLEGACADAVSWRKPYIISVNVSAAQLRQVDLPQAILSILDRTGLPANRLELEVTESLLIGDSEKALRFLTTMREEGVGIALDDFGTGYSSLSYLRRFPFSKLKIDKSFVQNFEKTEEDAAIVRAILALGRSLHLRVVAEGVETQAQLRFLREEECDQVQGFLLARPMPAKEVNSVIGIGVARQPFSAIGPSRRAPACA